MDELAERALVWFVVRVVGLPCGLLLSSLLVTSDCREEWGARPPYPRTGYPRGRPPVVDAGSSKSTNLD